MLTLFVARHGGKVTTFGVTVHALVVAALLPYSVAVWGVTPARAEDISTPLPVQLSRETPSKAFPDAPGAFANKEYTDIPDALSPQLHLSAGLAPVTTGADGYPRREQHIRLARFLSAPSAASDAVTTLDSLLAKAYTVRSSRGRRDRGAIRVYRSGKEVMPNAPSSGEGESSQGMPEPVAPSPEQVLAEGDALLEQSRVSDAFLAYFAIVNTWPDSSESLAVDSALNNLIWDADRGLANVNELRAFADGLPGYAECASDKAVYWLTRISHNPDGR